MARRITRSPILNRGYRGSAGLSEAVQDLFHRLTRLLQLTGKKQSSVAPEAVLGAHAKEVRHCAAGQSRMKSWKPCKHGQVRERCGSAQHAQSRRKTCMPCKQEQERERVRECEEPASERRQREGWKACESMARALCSGMRVRP